MEKVRLSPSSRLMRGFHPSLLQAFDASKRMFAYWALNP